MKHKRLSVGLLVGAMIASLLPTSAFAQETRLDAVTVETDGTIDGITGDNVTLVVDGVETALEPGTYTGDIVVTTTDTFSVLGSGSSGAGGGGGGGGASGGASGSSDSENEEEAHIGVLTKTILGTELRNARNSTDYRTAIYVDAEGIQDSYSVTAAVVGGTVDNDQAQGVSILAESDTFSGLVVEGTNYTLAQSTIALNTQSAGGTTNDFTGLGAAISANGAGTILTVEDSDISTQGVVKPALFISGGADVIVRSTALSGQGGTVYDTYLSNANQGTMIGAPWHLGINNAKGNSRVVNLMGTQSTETVVDSTIYAAGWGGLSVDDGSYMRMDVINSTIQVDEGYGAFAIGQVTEHYYGTDVSAGVLDFIMMGGHIVVGSYTGGDEISIKRMTVKDEGEGIDTYYAQETDEEIAVVSSDDVEVGKTVSSHLFSERFGFELHSMMLNDTVNTVTLEEGTTLATGETSFIVKSGYAELTLDDATVYTGISPYTGDRVFLQVMDNDDGFCGLTDFQHSTFGEYFWEPDGWSFEFKDTIDTDDYDLQGNPAYDVCAYGTEASSNLDQWWVKLNLTDTDITGDIWNSTGYWTQGGSDLYVTIGNKASVTGVISAGSYQHYAKTYEVGLYGYYSASGDGSVPLEENTWYNSDNSGSWENAKYISVVTNTPYFYGANGVNVTLTDGGTWNVTDVSFVTGLTVDGGDLSQVSGIYQVTLDVNSRENQTDEVTVIDCIPVDWDGGDIQLEAEDIYTIFVLIPQGHSIDDVIVVGENLGYSAKDFEGLYLGSFYDPTVGLLDSPLDIYS